MHPENRVHGIRPENRNTAKLRSGIRIISENTKAVTAIVSSGLINVHMNPRTVRRYRRLTY
jgi:hypothetical protein